MSTCKIIQNIFRIINVMHGLQFRVFFSEHVAPLGQTSLGVGVATNMLALWARGRLGLLDATMLTLYTSNVNRHPNNRRLPSRPLGEIPGTEAIHD